MRLDINVLWVDDQPGQLAPQLEAIARQMRDHGFEFKPTICRTIDEVQALVREEVFVDEVDLICVDWDLGKNLKGQEVISAIRESILYKDVVFYSSLTGAKELREYAFKAGVEGVYCTSKGSIVTEVINVFESLIKKVLDLDHTRGIVMGATSDIDGMVLECLSGIEAKGDKEAKKALVEKARKIVAKRIKDLQKKAEELDVAEEMGVILQAHALFGANDRLRVLSEALGAKDYDDYGTLRTGLKGYIQDVVPMRNELGHLVLTPMGKPTALGTTDGKEVSLDDMRSLRVTLLGLRADFRKLRDSFGGK